MSSALHSFREIKREAEVAIAYGRCEYALKAYTGLLERTIGRLKTTASGAEAAALKTMTKESMSRAEFLKIQVAARPKGVAGAMDLLAVALNHIVPAVMRKRFGDDWESRDKRKGRKDAKARDLSGWLGLLVRHFNDLPWNDPSDPACGFTRTLCFEVKHWRNAWAHQRLRSPDDAYRAIDSIERLLRGMGQKVPLAKAYASDCAVFFKPQSLAAIKVPKV